MEHHSTDKPSRHETSKNMIGQSSNSLANHGFVVVDSMLILVVLMLIFTPIVGFCNCSMFCSALLYFHSSFATILMEKRELVALLYLSSWCLVIVVWLFLTMPRVCLQFGYVVFPDHTHLLFYCEQHILPQKSNITIKARQQALSLPQ